MIDPVLQIRSLTKTFAGPRRRVVLENLNLHLAVGDYIAVMGESGVGKSTLLNLVAGLGGARAGGGLDAGVGKSTLLNLVAGLDRPDAGEILIDGVSLADLDDDALTRLRGERMGFVFQAFHILPYLSVFQNVELPLRLMR